MENSEQTPASSEPRKRKRIPFVPKDGVTQLDPLSFTSNKSSQNARKVLSINVDLEISLWHDKHYHYREQLGDEDGKREGIDTDNVEALVVQSIRHLLFYSAFLKNFTFLNHNYKPSIGRALRVVCQKDTLNVIIEVHFVSLTHYEVTVITAMCKENFDISDGQYAIEMMDDDMSVLRKSDRKKVVEVYNL